MNKSINYFYLRTEERKNEHIVHLKTIESFFQEKFNLPIYLIYGTLLGTIREGDFISKDKDIDLAYLSNFHTEKEVKEEIVYLNNILQFYGMIGKTFGNKGQRHVKNLGNTFTWFDVWTSWIDENKRYHLSPIGPMEVEETDIIPFNKKKLRIDNFLIPKNSEKILDLIYNDWKYPIENDKNWAKLKPTKKF
jgi:hypothetical protein